MQGAFHRHCMMVESLGVPAMEVRTAGDIASVSGLIIPGGESTVMSKLLTKNGLMDPLRERVMAGMPVFGTCAGMIIISRDAGDFGLPLVSAMNISVERNAYGRQLESFEATFPVKGIEGDAFSGIFIRAPKITRVGAGVEVLAEFEGVPVLVRERNLLASSFHPELTGDPRIHSLFLSMIR